MYLDVPWSLKVIHVSHIGVYFKRHFVIALHVSLIVMEYHSKNVGIAGNTNSNNTHIKVLIMKVREL